MGGLLAAHSVITPLLVWGGLAAMALSGFGLGRLFFTAPTVVLPPALQAIVQAAGPPPRVFLEEATTPKVLREKIEGRTTLQITAITKTYAGKWIRVSGTLSDVAEVGSGRLMMHLRDRDGVGTAFVFPEGETQRLLALNKGDRVTAIGKITGLLYGPTTEDAEIEQIDGPAPPPKPKRVRRAKPNG